LSAADEAPDPRVAAVVAALCPEPVARIARTGGGGNSRLYRVDAAGRSYALKSYPPKGDDPRDRLGVECRALGFMAAHGVACVPRLFASDAAQGFGLFEWIDGAVVTDPGVADIDQAVAFLAAIRTLGAVPGADRMPSASEACLSGAEIVRQITARSARLAALAPNEPALAGFLAERVAPLLVELAAWTEAGYRAAGLAFDADLAPELRALIPADFGFHNALRQADGRLVFIDFEYFGWDDPVKLTADFLLHPAMALPEALKRRFGGAICDAFAPRDAAFPDRLRLLYPLFAMRWCLILLNEFLPDQWARRARAGASLEWPTAKRRQLERAGALLDSIARSYRIFAYAG